MKHLLTLLSIIVTLTSCAQTAGDFLFQEKASGIGFVPHYLTPSDTNLLGFDGAGGITSYPWPEGGADFGQNVAFVRGDGNDGSAVMGNPSKPYATMQAAADALGAVYGGVIVTLDLYTSLGAGLELTGPWQYAIITSPSGWLVGDIGVDESTLNVTGGVLDGTVSGSSNGQLWLRSVQVTGEINAASCTVVLDDVRAGDINISGGSSLRMTGTTCEALSFYSALSEMVIDRSTLDGITNAYFAEQSLTANNVVTTNDTTGQMLDITGLGNCFACTDGGGPVDTPALTDVLGEGNATAGKNIVITSGDSIDFLHSTYTGRLTKAALTGNRAWALPNSSGYLALTNSSTGAITYLDVAGLGPMATSSNPSDLAQEGATDGQVLTWDSTAGEWVPETPSGGGGSQSLGDVLAVGNYAGDGVNIDFSEDGFGTRWVGSGGGSVTLTSLADPESDHTLYLPTTSGTLAIATPINTTFSDFTTTSGTLVTVTDAGTYLEANTTYNYEIQCEWSSSNNAGTILASVTTPSGATVTGYRKNGRADGTMNAGGITGDDSGNVSGSCVTANTRLHVSIEGKVITGGTDGAIWFRVASNSGYTLTIYEGCSVSATKVK